MLRADTDEVAERLLADSDDWSPSAELRGLVDSLDADDLAELVRDLGGHDLGLLVDTFRRRRRPTAPRSCSPTRSRAAGCPPRATPTTTPRC